MNKAVMPGAAGSRVSEQLLNSISLRAALVSFAIILFLIFLTAISRRRKGAWHSFLFRSIIVVVAGATALLVGTTVYLNTHSYSKGPVHWHADFEVWACGQKLDLVNPKGRLNNKVGTPTVHEHNDGRIHVEGVVANQSDATLGHFFKVVGGQLTDNTLLLPTEAGTKTYFNGGRCSDGPAELQVFVYTSSGGKLYHQRKLKSNFANYVMSPHQNIPPGDCIIVEYGQPRMRTNHLCLSYQAAHERDGILEAR